MPANGHAQQGFDALNVPNAKPCKAIGSASSRHSTATSITVACPYLLTLGSVAKESVDHY